MFDYMLSPQRRQGFMEKSIATDEHRVFRNVLRQFRRSAGLTQTQLAESIGETQSFVSKVERGELRLDLVQLRTICRAIGKELEHFVREFEAGIEKRSSSRS